MHAEHAATFLNGFFPVGIWLFGSGDVETVFIFHSSPKMMGSCKVFLCVAGQKKSGKDTFFFPALFFIFFALIQSCLFDLASCNIMRTAMDCYGNWPTRPAY